ncbi:PAS domain S-box protein [Paenibacillus sp. XY044]|uniref:PAS domain S-box protein n=1 Tax=Paenibacillus sp. XY044 TaxID=2026089 RepID=UPI000B99ACB7|nr:PAS domain S-box protein [Paenibacillus sp. XY044]OZB92260.1 hypothetical protein CJP46_25340 [Paenibacillus sp. XY044]
MHRKPSDKDLEKYIQEMEGILREQQGMTFKFIKDHGRFVHTFCAGQLMSKMGLDYKEVVGNELKDFLPAEAAAIKEGYYAKAWEGSEGVTYEGESQGVYYLASLRPIRQNGKVIEVIASCVDITERKKAEIELQRTKKLLESIIDDSADGICIIDTGGNVVRVNHSFEMLYGWSEKELVGRQLPIVPLEIEDELKAITKEIQGEMQAKTYETTRLKKGGELIHVSITLSPIKNDCGEIIALTGITRDISERIKSEELFRKADKLNVVGQLAAGLAHEIRNPLTSLKGFLQIMKSSEMRKVEHCEIMLSEVDRMNSIINELLIFSKPQPKVLKKNDIGILLQSVVILLEAQATMSGVQVYVEIHEDLPPIDSSEVDIKQVFVNVLKNAIEATPKGGNIHIVAFVQLNDIIVRVTDEGVGIPTDNIHRLGEPFYTTKEQGTGLGLMMCYKIIHDHKGSLLIQSTLNQGTTVDITLPFAN